MKNSGDFTLTARGEREIVMTRIFDAPPDRLFEALTQPELIKRWLLGPSGWSMPLCEVDLKVGGAYRYVWRHTNGNEMAMGGVYREIARPTRLVHSEKFDQAWYSGEALITTILVDEGGRTKFTATMLYESREARDGVLKSGMGSGVIQSYDRLAELLAS